jgi:hypothetical protein
VSEKLHDFIQDERDLTCWRANFNTRYQKINSLINNT